jgi:predicted ribosomally synthesized peptide with nif11-like leader
MSVQAVNQFLQKVSEDEKLQQELTNILQAGGEDRKEATELAAKYGYQFTPDELWQEIQHRQSEFQANKNSGELNEEDLEAVAGGATPGALIWTVGMVAASAVGNARW